MRISVLLSVFFTILVLFTGEIVNAQNVGINATGSTPNVSAGLDIDFTNKGLLVPRVALTSTADVTTIATPQTSLLIYNTATAGVSPNNVTPGFYYYSGTAWVKLAIASGTSNDWTTTGNAGTTPGTNFIGTTDSKDLVFKTNGVEDMRLEVGGNLGLSTNDPEEKLHISNNGGGHILMDKDVRLKSQRVSPAADFNLIGFGGPYDEMEIGEWTNEINAMIVKVPLASNLTTSDGAIEFRDITSTEPMFKLMEDHKSGINTSLPEELFHIGNTGGGNMLLDKDVRIKSQRVSPAADFNLIGFGGPYDEMEIGEWTNEINAMIVKVPLASNLTTSDGAIEFRDNTSTEPMFKLMEDHKSGINTSLPEELFHIGNTGGGNMLLDKDVRIKSQRVSPASDFNLIGFGGPYDEIEIGEWSNEINGMILRVPLANNFTTNDGSIEFRDNIGVDPLMRFQEDHKIGINTNNPQELLHVNGKVKIGAYTLPDTDGTIGQVLTTNGSGVVSWGTAAGTQWGLTGNTGTNPATNFIGTIDNSDFVARTNNTERLRILANGNVGIGNNAPVYKLQVESNTHNYTGYFANNNTSNTGNVGVVGNCYGSAAGTNTGVQGRGYNGNAGATTTYGVMGSSQSNYGVGRAVAGFAWDSPTTVGVYGASVAQNSVTINSYGVQGSAGGSATNHYGVYGEAIGPGTTVYGVYGRASSSSTTAYAIYGRENSPTAVTGYGIFSEAIGTGATTNYGIYATASGAVTNWAGYFIGNSYISGNVGIGTTTPTAKLELAGQIKITGGTPGAGKVLVSDATGLATWQTVAGVGGQWMLTGNSGTVATTNFIGTTDAVDFVTRTNNTEQMRITSAGNVGIGLTNPTQKLDVVGNIYANNGQYKVFNSTNDLYRGSLGKYGSANGFDFNSVSATTGIALENGDSESGGFYADGDMAGIWSPGDNDLLKLWDEDGMILRSRLDNTGTWFALAFTATSDERMKKNIRQLPDSSLQKIMQLNGKIYDWKEEILFKGEIEAGKEIPYDQLKNKIGFIAQELELVFPELVETNKTTGFKAVNYDGMIPVLVEGMKEQQAQIDELKQQNELLLKELQEMRAALKLKLEEK